MLLCCFYGSLSPEIGCSEMAVPFWKQQRRKGKMRLCLVWHQRGILRSRWSMWQLLGWALLPTLRVRFAQKGWRGAPAPSDSLLSTTESTGHSQPCSPWITPVHRAPVTTETKEMIPLNSARDDREEVRKEWCRSIMSWMVREDKQGMNIHYSSSLKKP